MMQWNSPPSILIRKLLAWSAEVAFLFPFSVWIFSFLMAEASTLPLLAAPEILLLCAFIQLSIGLLTFGAPLGYTIVGLGALHSKAQRAPRSLIGWMKSTVFVKHPFPLKTALFRGGAILAASLILSSALLLLAAKKNPAWRTIKTEFWTNSRPAALSLGESIPLFYNVLPTDVFLKIPNLVITVPYEKGPPTRFLGRIRLTYSEALDGRLDILGPLTFKGAQTREALHYCLSNNLHCPSVREAWHKQFVTPYFQGFKFSRPIWFEALNPNLPLDKEKPMGLYIQARNEGTGQVKKLIYLINAQLATSVFDITCENLVSCDRYLEIAKQLITPSKSIDDLSAARVHINQLLANFSLEQISPGTLTRAQLYLVSKISVDPADFWSYFYFAKVSHDLLKAPELSRFATLRALIEKGLDSIWKLAKDVDPKNEKLVLIENLAKNP